MLVYSCVKMTAYVHPFMTVIEIIHVGSQGLKSEKQKEALGGFEDFVGE